MLLGVISYISSLPKLPSVLCKGQANHQEKHRCNLIFGKQQFKPKSSLVLQNYIIMCQVCEQDNSNNGYSDSRWCLWRIINWNISSYIYK